MAITSIAGGTFTRSTGLPSASGFLSMRASGWFKTPSVGARTMVAIGGTRLVIGLDAANRLQLTLDNVIVGVGTTQIPINTWFRWVYKKATSGTVHTLQLALAECISGIAGMQPNTTEVSVVITPVAGAPSSYTVHVPAGCAVCNQKLTTSSVGLDTHPARLAWAVVGSLVSASQYYWAAPMRFPNDLYDHREISGTNGQFFSALHAWTSTTGTFAQTSDPGILLNKYCSAVLGISGLLGPIVVSAPNLPPGGPAYTGTTAVPLTIRTDVLPAGATLDRIQIGAVADLVGPGTLQPNNVDGVWFFAGDPAAYGPYTGSAHYTYYDWFHLGAPNPQVNNPSTGTAWTLADLYGATLQANVNWGGSTALFGPTNTRASYRLHQAGLAVLYYGQTTTGTCGEDPEPVTAITRRKWLRRATHLSAEDINLFHHAFELDMEVGVGNEDAPIPQVMLRWSDDGGHTWSNEHWRSAGISGDYGKRVRWQRLGAARDRVYEVSGSDPVKVALIDAYLKTTAGRH